MNRLRVYDTVTVNIPFASMELRVIDVFDARVLAIVGPTAALEPIRALSSLRLPDRVPDVLMSFRHGHALVGLKGTLTLSRVTDDLRFTVVDGVQLNRRSATRIDKALVMELAPMSGGETVAGRSIDLSADGILAETSLAAKVGDLVRIWIEIGEDEAPVAATARVVRAGGGLVAMQFAPGASTVRSRLGRLVVEHNRELLRARDLELVPVEF